MFRTIASAGGALALVLGFGTSSAVAGSVTFKDFVNQDGNGTGAGDWIDFVVTVHDEMPGKFVVNVGHTATSPNLGDITGVFFDVYEGITPSSAQVTKIVGDIKSVDDDTSNLSGGANVTPIPAFDLGVQYHGLTRKVGATTYLDDLQSVSFSMSNLGFLTLEDFTRFGLRAQSVAPNGVDRVTYNLQGSTKEYSTTTSGNVVPLPGAAWGGMALIGALGGARLRRGYIAPTKRDSQWSCPR
jgi:hypothetical protein